MIFLFGETTEQLDGKTIEEISNGLLFLHENSFLLFHQEHMGPNQLEPVTIFKEGLNVKFCDLYFLVAT